MTNVYSLDQLREDVERKFAPITIELGEGERVVLRNLLRVPKREREQVFALMDSMDELEDAERASAGAGMDFLSKSADLAKDIIVLVADSRYLGQKLVDNLGDDLALTLQIFEMWMKATQPGEAESSLT
ncbi:Uncharacterised protein [Nocardia farcinica]|uniref:phage tail assembly protein n=1 Tax=Nocardia farcinica TaxID=37329 RepID=UPI000E0587D0|nr:phage tail assembly protein [Nocardia farcinica]SUE29608.1 Uncharacterised protein [Nocardia farcinica]